MTDANSRGDTLKPSKAEFPFKNVARVLQLEITHVSERIEVLEITDRVVDTDQRERAVRGRSILT